jgi:threonine synthase
MICYPIFIGLIDMQNHQLTGIQSGSIYPASQPLWYGNGELLNVNILEPFNPYKINKNLCSQWRYENYMVLPASQAITLGEGFTPLLPVNIGGKTIHIKQEQLFPTGSYKDRGASVLMSIAKQLGVDHVVQDSSGNAGCAIAAYAAKGNIKADVYVPASTSPAKLAQMRMYGASLMLVEGSREDTARAAWQAAQQTYYASHCYNPYFFEGTKTFAYEVCEQLNWNAPDVVVLPAGNGTLVIGCYIGFRHLLESGVIPYMPRLVAVQSASCAPLYHAWKNGSNQPQKNESRPTVAEGIAIAEPVRGSQIIDIINKTKGAFVTVTDAETIDALKLCCNMGYYIEPTSAATIAGIHKALPLFEGETWVSLFSGHGLKSTEKMLQLLSEK